MWTVIFDRLAAKEARRAESYYSIRDRRLALRFRGALDFAWRRIAEDPISLAIWKPPVRFIRVKRFPYVLYFREIGEREILILAVAHTSRRSGYWLRRNRNIDR